MMLPLFTFIGCSDDDEKKIPDEMKNIYGTWVLNQVDTGNGDGYVDWPMKETSATFNEDGTYSRKWIFWKWFRNIYIGRKYYNLFC